MHLHPTPEKLCIRTTARKEYTQVGPAEWGIWFAIVRCEASWLGCEEDAKADRGTFVSRQHAECCLRERDRCACTAEPMA